MIILRIIWIVIQVIVLGVCLVTVVPLWILVRHIIPNMLSDLWDKLTKKPVVFENTGGGYRDVVIHRNSTEEMDK